jgi:hypothetical protein
MQPTKAETSYLEANWSREGNMTEKNGAAGAGKVAFSQSRLTRRSDHYPKQSTSGEDSQATLKAER